jgi:uncharacterized GH25 family protein
MRAISLTLILFTSWLAQAHEFWMQPKKFRYAVGDEATVNFMVGENFVGEFWDLKKHRVILLDHYAGSYFRDLHNEVKPDLARHLEVKLQKEGTHLFVMRSNNAFIELEGEKFNAYLKEDGLDDVYNHRVRTQTLYKPATEFYARCAKLLLQAGATTDDTYKKEAGLPLEIVPVQNPYTLKIGDEITFKLLYEGKPLEFTLMKVWNRKDGNTIMQNIYTQKDGMITTRLSNTGSWMVSAVKMVPSKEEGAEWQSYWASLVFGIH